MFGRRRKVNFDNNEFAHMILKEINMSQVVRVDVCHMYVKVNARRFNYSDYGYGSCNFEVELRNWLYEHMNNKSLHYCSTDEICGGGGSWHVYTIVSNSTPRPNRTLKQW